MVKPPHSEVHIAWSYDWTHKGVNYLARWVREAWSYVLTAFLGGCKECGQGRVLMVTHIFR